MRDLINTQRNCDVALAITKYKTATDFRPVWFREWELEHVYSFGTNKA